MKKINIGIVGLGKAFMLMVPTFYLDERVCVAGAYDLDTDALQQFSKDFPEATLYTSYSDMCNSPNIDLVYVATPHQYHAEHALTAIESAKHVLIEKPMALSLEDCDRLIDAAQNQGVVLMEGHSHSIDAPVARVRQIVESGVYGCPTMLHMMNYTDFLYRPRRPEELQTDKGGGVLFNQAPHQVSMARRLAMGQVIDVNAFLGKWDLDRGTEGAYALQLKFDNGVFASITYSGYAHFDTDILMGGITEIGRKKSTDTYGLARKNLKSNASLVSELEFKKKGGYGRGESLQTLLPKDAVDYHHFGFVILSCEGADLLPTPTGVDIYSDHSIEKITLPKPDLPRKEVIDELYSAITFGEKPFHCGEWARETLRICINMTYS